MVGQAGRANDRILPSLPQPRGGYGARVRTLRYSIVDVFADAALEGNPLAVFTGGDGLDERTMLALARETNLSETTFLQRAEGDGTARLRITLSAAHTPQQVEGLLAALEAAVA